MHRVHTCVYEVYLRVFERIQRVRGEGLRELQEVAANLDALLGGARLAAGLAKVDAEAERPPRPSDDICRCICDKSECLAHPHRR